jgi:CRP-like cAMP-binding protein
MIPKGQTIFQGVETNTRLYFINKGVCHVEVSILTFFSILISQILEKGKPMRVATLVKGQCFGEVSFLRGRLRNFATTATIVADADATEDVELAVVEGKERQNRETYM